MKYHFFLYILSEFNSIWHKHQQLKNEMPVNVRAIIQRRDSLYNEIKISQLKNKISYNKKDLFKKLKTSHLLSVYTSILAN